APLDGCRMSDLHAPLHEHALVREALIDRGKELADETTPMIHDDVAIERVQDDGLHAHPIRRRLADEAWCVRLLAGRAFVAGVGVQRAGRERGRQVRKTPRRDELAQLELVEPVGVRGQGGRFIQKGDYLWICDPLPKQWVLTNANVGVRVDV